MYNEGLSPTLTNCILWGDTGGEIEGTPAAVTYSDIQGGYWLIMGWICASAW
jgi:hypothetical protein